MGPVSGTGRAMMASLNSAVQKGMPVDQAIAYVKSMAKDGVAPLVDLYAMLNQYQRLQQRQVQPPQTPPTIRDQMNMMEAVQQPAMEQGLGGMNSGVMENAQFAGGGIVAFQEGGLSRSAEIAKIEERLQQDNYIKSGVGGFLGRAVQTRTLPLGYADRQRLEKLLAELKAMPEEAPSVQEVPEVAEATESVGAPSAASPYDYFAPQEASIFDRAPSIQPDEGMRREVLAKEREAAQAIPDFTSSERQAIQKQIDELQGATPKSRAERYREAGIEDAIPGQIERIREQMSGLDEERKRDRYLALAEAGFAGAAEAAKPGATFLGSIGVGATAGTRRLGEVNKEYRNLRSNLMGKIDEMERYRQGRLEGQIDRDIEFERESTKEMRRLQKDLASLNTELGKFQETAALTREGREAQQNPINMLQKQLIDAMESGDEARIKQLSERLAALTELSPSVIIARLQAATARQKALANRPSYMLPNAGQEDPELTSLLNKYGG